MKEAPRKSGFQKGKSKIKAEWEWLLLKDMECQNLELWNLDILFMEQQKKNKKIL